MKLIRGIDKLRRRFNKPVLAIGIFDGVHSAHQGIIKEAVRQARMLRGTSVVLTFNPHPLKIFDRCSLVPLITSLEHRIDLIGRLGVDICLVADFDKELSRRDCIQFKNPFSDPKR